MNSKDSLHHIKYKEIDGVDEYIIIPKDIHQAEHTKKDKITGRYFKHSTKERVRASQLAYHRALREPRNRIVFYTVVGEFARVAEQIVQNPATNSVSISSYYLHSGR